MGAKRRMLKNHTAENELSAAFAKEYNFPELWGTERQVAWAETIRYNLFWKTDRELLDAINTGTCTTENAIRRANNFMGIINTVTRAKSWINIEVSCRYCDGKSCYA